MQSWLQQMATCQGALRKNTPSPAAAPTADDAKSASSQSCQVGKLTIKFLSCYRFHESRCNRHPLQRIGAHACLAPAVGCSRWLNHTTTMYRLAANVAHRAGNVVQTGAIEVNPKGHDDRIAHGQVGSRLYCSGAASAAIQEVGHVGGAHAAQAAPLHTMCALIQQQGAATRLSMLMAHLACTQGRMLSSLVHRHTQEVQQRCCPADKEGMLTETAAW